MFDRFDICEAYFMFAMLWHGGQSCPIYRIFGRLDRVGFRPSPLLCNEDDLSFNSRLIYDQLVANHLRSR